MVAGDDKDFETERNRLSGLIDRFAAAGPAGCTSHPHAFFGPLTPDEWAVLMYKHLDHHLRQFGARLSAKSIPAAAARPDMPPPISIKVPHRD